MNTILKMQNTIQAYAWGSKTAIARLMGRPFPTETPEAELWLGAHPKAPSKVWVDNCWHPLNEWIAQNPIQLLGAKVCERFNAELPYLFKILAAGQPLSIQAHPSQSQARIGFENENRLNIAMDAAHRNYKDPQHKPECICALTPFWALCGFRREQEMLTALEKLWPLHRRAELAILENSGVKPFFKHLLSMAQAPRMELVHQVTQKAAAMPDPDAIQQWIVRLQAQYPNDVGVLSPGFLNLIQLQPGEAIALGSGQLHAYLDGLGIELMANSDNVLRGGLTPKHVDVVELLKVLDFNPKRPEILRALDQGGGERFYPSQAAEFKLFVVETRAQQAYRMENRVNTPEILLCTQGEARLAWQLGAQTLTLTAGQSAFVPAAVDQYTISGTAILYKAAVNI